MPSTALKSFVQAFHNAPTASKGTALFPVYLTSATIKRNATLSWRVQNNAVASVRQFASVNSPAKPHLHTLKDLQENIQSRDGAVQHLLSSKRKRTPESWEALLDRYLPHALRIQGKETNPDLEQDDRLPIENVAVVLASARASAQIDLLSYIGIYQDRWDAVIWLVESMLEGCPPYSVLDQKPEKLPCAPWNSHSRTLEEATRDHIKIKTTKLSNPISLDEYFSSSTVGTGRIVVAKYRQVLGQVWQSLGCMILEAEDRSAKDPTREQIMSLVLQILAHIHHLGSLPLSIYNYEVTGEPGSQRPPTIYMLSRRIMTVLSDVAWKSHWVGEMEKAKSYGYELPPPRVQPILPFVGTDIWLELVLWASVEGGWITEAAWVVAEIERRRPNPELQWSVISWQEAFAARKPELKLMAKVKLEMDRSRMDQATGVPLASRGSSLPAIEMGTRKISREVVLAIMDGLVNTVSTENHLYGITVMEIRQYILHCKNLLERERPDLDPNHLNALILRVIESSTIDIRRQPNHLRLLLEIAPKSAQPRSDGNLDSYTSGNVSDFSAAFLGLLHKTLDGFSRRGELLGSFTALKLIQDVIDANREIYIQEFADKLRERLLRGSENMDVATDYKKRNAPMLYPEIPPYTVEAVLDLLVESKSFDLGRWLLLNEDIDGGLMSPNLFSEALLLPALLRFATASADDQLLIRVLENLQAPLSQPILHALLDCQVALNKWSAVEGILDHFRDTEGMAWTSLDATRIAAMVVALEREDDKANEVQILRAKGILQDLVHGKFNSPRKQADVPDLRELQRANQLARIFQSVAGSLSTSDLPPQGYLGRGAYSISIPPEAFQVLLGSVVDHHGPTAGLRLWKRWCLKPTRARRSAETEAFSAMDGRERVVQPTALMLRLIMRPVISDLENAFQSSAAASENGRSGASQGAALSKGPKLGTPHWDESIAIFEWGIKMYRSFGFPKHKILSEIPPSLRHLMRRV